MNIVHHISIHPFSGSFTIQTMTEIFDIRFHLHLRVKAICGTNLMTETQLVSKSLHHINLKIIDKLEKYVVLN